MESKEIDKNILEAKYQKELQEYNAILIAVSVGILAFFGTFIWSFEKLAPKSKKEIDILLLSSLRKSFKPI